MLQRRNNKFYDIWKVYSAHLNNWQIHNSHRIKRDLLNDEK